MAQQTHKNKVRHAAISLQTQIRLRQDRRQGVRLGRVDLVGYLDAEDGDVEEVVDDVHAPVRGGPRRTVEGALVERLVRDVEGRLEEVLELVEDERYRRR